jgi:hypothetical protein
MRTSIALCCCLFAASLGAQAPATGGVFTLLRGEPFQADVTSVSTSPMGFKLSLRSMDGGVKTFETMSSRASLEQQFVAQLKADRRYAFPQCIVDFLGLEQTVNMLRSLPAAGSFFSPTPAQQPGVLDLGRDHPFRATVLDQGIGENSYSLVLQGANSQLHVASGSFSTDIVKRIAEGLKRGETYEFPSALDDVLLSEAERASKARPKTPAAAVLGRYIGAWSGTMESDPAARILMNCHWLADGSGIWRELTFDRTGSEVPPSLDIARITFDAGAKSYAIADPAADKSLALLSTWNEATQTFTTTLPAAGNGQTRINTATFTAENRIDWKTVTLDSRGKVLGTNRGNYVRTAKSVPPVQLPPPSAKPTVAVQTSTSNSGIALPTLSGGPQPPNLTAASQLAPNVIYSDFFKLRDQPPFRGKLMHIEFKAHSFSATIDRIDQRQVSVYHTRDENWDKALAIAKRLTPGIAYDFPAVLADDFQPPPDGLVPKASTDAMRTLAPFIGEWTMHWTTGPAKDRAEKITIRYYWTNDGTGLWREVHVPAGVSAGRSPQTISLPHVETTLTSYDPATKKYYEVHSSAQKPDERTKVEWDDKTQTYSLIKNEVPASTDLQFSGTRRIVSPDRIEFQSKTTKADGTLVNESAGYYQRAEP